MNKYIAYLKNFLIVAFFLTFSLSLSSWYLRKIDERNCKFWKETQDKFFQFQIDICEKFGVKKEKYSKEEEKFLREWLFEGKKLPN